MHVFAHKKIFAFVCIVFCFLAGADRVAKGWKMVDYNVYYKTGNRFLLKEKIYQNKDDGHYVFKYSPVFAASMIGLSAMPIDFSIIAYLLILAGWFSVMMIYLNNRFFNSSHHELTPVILVCLIFIKHIQKEIHLGQINIILISLLTLSILLKNKVRLRSLFFVATVFIKPVGIIILPILIYKHQTQRIFWMMFWIGFLIVGSWLVHLDLEYTTTNYAGWVHEILAELKMKTDLNSLDTQTLVAAVHRTFQIGTTISFAIALMIVITIIYVGAKFYKDDIELIAISTIPLLTCTSNNFYILSIPIFYLGITKFTEMHKLSKAIFIISCILMVFNQYEIFGRTGVDSIDFYAPYAWSVLLCFSSLLYHKKSQIENHERV